MQGMVPDFRTEPVFVFTSDVDWASEDCIGHLLALTADAGIVPMVFATHRSARLDAALRAGQAEVGLHPNFLPGSTHGATPAEVLSHLHSLYPAAWAMRSHVLADSSRIAMAAASHGLACDSSLCLQGQNGLVPLHLWTGTIRYPIFWEDDVHWLRGASWNFGDIPLDFFSPGLKIINAHPFNLALNIPAQDWFERHKAMAGSLTAAGIAQLSFPGTGTATFIAALIEAVHRRGHRFHPLSAVHASYVGTCADGAAPLLMRN